MLSIARGATFCSSVSPRYFVACGPSCLSQQVWFWRHTFLPQQLLPSVAQKGCEVVEQHIWLFPQEVFPQHCLPLVTTNGFEPVVQQVWLPSQELFPQQVLPFVTQKGGEPVVQQVWPRAQVWLPQACSLARWGSRFARSAGGSPTRQPRLHRTVGRRYDLIHRSADHFSTRS